METNDFSKSIEAARLAAAEDDFERRSEQEQDDNFYCADRNRCGAICEAQCNACRKAENMPENFESVSQEIDRFISENGNNVRDALNVALTRLQLLELRVQLLMNEDDKYPDTQADGCVFCGKCGMRI